MLPIRAQALAISRIAEFIAREANGVRTRDEVIEELLQAFWRGELRSATAADPTRDHRRDLLRAINIKRRHPGLVLVESAKRIPEPYVINADGSVTLDQHRYIALPPHPAQWTDPMLEAAYQCLAELRLEDFNDLVMPALWGLRVRKDDFGQYCELMGYPKPRFWFAPVPRSVSTAGSERRAEDWLGKQGKEGKKKSKAGYRQEAQERFNLSAGAFDRVWKKVVPPEWRTPGAPRKRRKTS